MARLREWGLLPYNPKTKGYDGDVDGSFNITTATKTIIANIDRRVIVPYAKLWPALQAARAKRQKEHDDKRALLARLFDILEPDDDKSKATGLADFDRGRGDIHLGSYWSGQACPVRLTYRGYGVDVAGNITSETSMIRLAETIAALNGKRPPAPEGD